MTETPKSSLPDNAWSLLVSRQLKTDDIQSVLQRPNLEGLEVLPYYPADETGARVLPRRLLSPVLVSDPIEALEEHSFATFYRKPLVSDFALTYFIDTPEFIPENLSPDDEVISLLPSVTPEGEYVSTPEVGPFSYCLDISVWQNSGASLVQQLVAMLLKAEILAKKNPDFWLKTTVRTALGPNYFFEVAKVRAVKLLYAQLAKSFDTEAIPLIFAESSQRSHTRLDPENNLIRMTLQLAAGMVGGADALYAPSYTLETDPLAQEISFKQQIVLSYESLLNAFEDPAAGSGFVQHLTEQLCQMAWTRFLELRKNPHAFQELQDQVYHHAIEEHQGVVEGRIKLVGINLFPSLSPKEEVSSLYQQGNIYPVRWEQAYE